MFSSEFFKILNNTFFTEHLRRTAFAFVHIYAKIFPIYTEIFWTYNIIFTQLSACLHQHSYIAAEKIFEVVQILAQILIKEIKPMKIYKCKLHVNCIPIHIYENNANADTLIFKTFSLLISLSIDIQTNWYENSFNVALIMIKVSKCFWKLKD